jgi:hypothetical protein
MNGFVGETSPRTFGVGVFFLSLEGWSQVDIVVIESHPHDIRICRHKSVKSIASIGDQDTICGPWKILLASMFLHRASKCCGDDCVHRIRLGPPRRHRGSPYRSQRHMDVRKVPASTRWDYIVKRVGGRQDMSFVTDGRDIKMRRACEICTKMVR